MTENKNILTHSSTSHKDYSRNFDHTNVQQTGALPKSYKGTDEISSQLNNPKHLIQLAIEQKADIAVLERLFELQLKYEANEAKKAYSLAMSKFKATPPEIEKDSHVKFTSQKGTTEYNHASLYEVTNKISKAMGEHGLSAAFNTEQDEKGIVKVTCTISHSLGHSESTSLVAAPDSTGNKSLIQAIGSTVTFLSRYTLLALTGLAAKEQDDDGRQSEPVEFINDTQVKSINTLIEKTKTDIKEFLKFFKIESLEKLQTSDFSKAMSILNAKVRVNTKKKG